METRANFVLIGAFTIAAVIGAFLFIMWIAGYGTPGGRTRYQVVFDGSVSGLSNGALVLFNGLKVGEVTHLGFVKEDPSKVIADIDVQAGTPINKDTKARLETQGLTGASALELSGGAPGSPPLEGENGKPPVLTAGPAQLQTILNNVEALSAKADTVLDQANKLIADNSESLGATISNAQVFSKALADNAPGVNAALKSVSDLGKQIEPLASKLETLSEDADRLVKAVDTDKVRGIVDNVYGLSGKANTVLDRADKLLAENSEDIRSTVQNAQTFSKALSDNAANIDAALKSIGDLGRTIQPVAARLQTLSEDADRVVKAVDPDKVREIVGNMQTLSSTANTAFDRVDKLLAENSEAIHSAIASADAVAKTLSDNSASIDAGLKGFGELGQNVERVRTLTEDADRVVKAVDPDQVRDIVGNVRTLSSTANTAFDRVDKLLAENSEAIHSTIASADVVATTLKDNSANIDAGLKGFADLGKNVDPVATRIRTLSEDADRLVTSVDPDKIRDIVGNAQIFSQSLQQSSDNFQILIRDGASLATRLNDTSRRLDTALIDVDNIFNAVDPKKISGMVNSASDVVETVHQNRGNIDNTLKNFAEMAAKLNDSADKVDGVLTSAQSFLGSPGTKGAVDRVSEAAESVKKLADDVDVRVKEIAVGLNRFSNSGLREYEALAIEGRRAIDDIDRVVRSIGSNPSQVIFGSRPSLPEYHGGQ